MKDNTKRVVLAYGEVTGHAHAFYNADAVEFDGNTLVVKAAADLEHEEHTKHTIEPGIGEVRIQQEYSRSTLRRVAD
jgi:predicted carbohydrate-binding protein with CBM5 and CBM33 domain